jgi:hypothetical protein
VLVVVDGLGVLGVLGVLGFVVGLGVDALGDDVLLFVVFILVLVVVVLFLDININATKDIQQITIATIAPIIIGVLFDVLLSDILYY